MSHVPKNSSNAETASGVGHHVVAQLLFRGLDSRGRMSYNNDIMILEKNTRWDAHLRCKDASVNRQSVTPLYYQVKELILQMIEKGELKIGNRLPTEKELCKKFEVSRITIRKAIEELVKDGVLYKERGKGTFVAHTKIQQGLLQLMSFTEEMKTQGFNVHSRILESKLMTANRKVAEYLGLDDGTQVLKVARLRFVNRDPVAFNISYFPGKLCKQLMEEDLSGSIYHLLEEKLGFALHKAVETLEIVSVNGPIARLLNVPQDSPALLIERVTYIKGGRPIEYVKSLFRGDKSRFYVELYKK